MAETQDIRRTLRALFAHVLEDLDIGRAMDRVKRRVERFILAGDATEELPVRIIAFGKAAVPMLEGVIDLCGPRAVDGVLSAPHIPARVWPGIRGFAGGHPVPNEDSLQAARAALEIAGRGTERDTVVFLISGGGSALLEAPIRPTIHIDDLQRLNATLVSCGADIVDINVVRKHLSAVKGGRLAEAASPARQLTLYISDVPPGHDSSVASGPSMPDESTLADLQGVVAKHELEDKLPNPVAAVLRDRSLAETPKAGDACFGRSQWICLLENRHAIEAACRLTESHGWSTEVDTSVDDIGVAAASMQLIERFKQLRAAKPDGPVCVVSGGELSSPVRGQGIGGRNQAFVLECVPRIAGEPIAILSAGTDGVDGNSPAAGAVADGTTAKRAHALGLDPTEFSARSDAYTFFKQLGDDITCGATENNVRDIRVLVSWR